MFTVKATYGGETRKLSFSGDTFPTFQQLCNQLYRVFSISRSYYLSKLLFSPNTALGGPILIGREVHTVDDYNKSIEPYKEWLWPQGLLRFSLHDEAPRGALNASQGSAGPFESHSWSLFAPGAGPSDVMTPPLVSHIPPPPIIYSSTSSTTGTMDVGNGLEGTRGKVSSANLCCSAQSTKQDIQKLITSFKEDLDDILKTSFLNKQATTPSPPLSTLPLPPRSGSSARVAGHVDVPGYSPLCSVCAQTKQCSWSVCDHCHVVECADCSGKSCSFCFGTMGVHRWRRNPTPPAMPPWLTTQLPSQLSSSADTPTSMPWSTPTDTQSLRRNSNATPAAPFIPPPMSPTPSEEASASNTPLARPVIHHGVICDGCENTIEGVRHKCLDCLDYDLCTNCILSGKAERHDPFHEFFEITKPGRVIIHRVNDRTPNVQQSRDKSQDPVVVSHHAMCDLCDSFIEGDRYKCLDCPDFDTCSNCFSITEIQHPGHAFARLRRSEDYIKCRRSSQSAHYATCNICTKRIYGTRFKCMHPDCPDFDLCNGCEAHPIPLHPEGHPLLKMKTPDTLIPEVCRHGLSPGLDLRTSRAGRHTVLPDVLCRDDHTPAVPIPPEPTRNSFIWGHMRAPSSGESCPQTSSVQPALIPRLDEISPSIVCGPFREEKTPLSRSPKGSNQQNTGSAIELAAEKGAEEDLTTQVEAASPTSVHRDADDLPQTPRRPTWPGSATELAHLMALTPLPRTTPPSPTPVRADAASEVFPAPSPFSGEETLLRPPVEDTSTDMRQKSSHPVTVTRQTLEMLLNGYRSPSSAESILSVTSSLEIPKSLSPLFEVSSAEIVQEPKSEVSAPVASAEQNHEEEESVKESTPPIAGRVQERTAGPVNEKPKDTVFYLSAMFVEDVTVSDGQVFPPGAEFMKCWRMLNDSEHDWPETTELVYVAGETLGTKKDSAVRVGLVKSGTEAELWTGELKAPDVAGRYVSYWRLRDGNGKLFGDSIWIDIVVADAHSTDDSDKSIASSLVIMPRSANAPATEQLGDGDATSTPRHQVEGQVSATLTIATVSAGSLTVATTSLPSSSSVDGLGSDTDSEVSLVSIPSSDDVELWEDVASSAGDPVRGDGQSHLQAIDYVLLYDDRSSEDE